MFKSPEQAESYFISIAFYNRHIGEFVVLALNGIHKLQAFFS